jgi:hypothetical protein
MFTSGQRTKSRSTRRIKENNKESDLISPLLFFQNKENGLNVVVNPLKIFDMKQHPDEVDFFN